MLSRALVLATLALSATAQQNSNSDSTTSTTATVSRTTGSESASRTSDVTNTTQKAKTTATTNPASMIITARVSTFTGMAGSIISADACDTTFALHCTDDSNVFCSAARDVTVTYTQGPTSYDYKYTSSGVHNQINFSVHCELLGKSGSYTADACTNTNILSYSIFGHESSTTTTAKTTFTDSARWRAHPVTITAGAKKLPTGTNATCTGAPTSTTSVTTTSANTTTSTGTSLPTGETPKYMTPTGGAAVARPTGMGQAYKVLVPMGAALVAGAGVLI